MTAALTIAGERLSGAQKGAVLCLVLGKEQAAKVMQLLSPAEVEAISREIAALTLVKAEVVDSVLREYREVARAIQSVAQGGIDLAVEILEAAVGTQEAKAILDRIRDTLTPTALARLKKAAPDMLLGVLRGEHPQTLALILAHLDVRQAAAVIEIMEPELAGEVLFRMARMDKVSPETLAMVEASLGAKADLPLTQELTHSGGPKAVAALLNLTSPSVEKVLLANLGERDPELGTQIKSLMFVFEDLKRLDTRAIQRVLRDVDSKDLALALKVVSDELKQRILSSMSERGAAALLEEMEFLGPVKVRDVEAAHLRIVQTVRALEEAGEITIGGGDDDVVV